MQDLRLAFIGDSFVNGKGDPDCLGWTGRLYRGVWQAGHSLTYYNLGVRGDTSVLIAARWQQEVASRLPLGCDGRLVFSFGVNDTVAEGKEVRVPLEESLHHTRQILTAAIGDYRVLMVGPPPVNEQEQNQRIEQLSAKISCICQDLSIPYLEVFAPLQNSSQWQQEISTYDGFHPRASGYGALASLVQGWVPWQEWFA